MSKSQARIRTKLVTETPTKTLAGEGRVHDCLRKNRDKLSDSCRQEELHLNIMQAQVRQLASAATLATEHSCPASQIAACASKDAAQVGNTSRLPGELERGIC